MLFFVFSAIIVAIDRLVKWWVASQVTLGSVTELIPGVLTLTHVTNSGAAFSFLSGGNARWVLAALSLIASVLLVVVIIKYPYGALGKTAASMILGGAFGNLIDRVLYGTVTDMFEFGFVNFAIWNIADAFVVIGSVMFVLSYVVSSNREINQKKQEARRRDNREKLASGTRADAMLTRSVLGQVSEQPAPARKPAAPPVPVHPAQEYVLPPKKPVNTDFTETQIIIDFEIAESMREL